MSSINLNAANRTFPEVLIALKECAPLRIIRAELAEIGKILRDSTMRDETTELLRLWQRNFLSSLRLDGNVPRALKEFTAQLQQILIDPIPRMIDPNSTAMLDNPRLGSDGQTYSFRSLTVFLSTTGIQSNRSPLRQNDPTDFTTQLHPVATYLVDWLKKFHGHMTDLENDEAYRKLLLEGRAAAIPSTLSDSDNDEERVRQIIVDQVAREQRKKMATQKGASRLDDLRAKLIKRITRAPDGIEEISQRIKDRLTAQKTRDADAISKQEKLMKDLEERIDNLDKAHREMEQSIKENLSKINEIDRQNCELDNSINELKIAVQEREGSWLKGLLITAAVIAACIAAQQAIAYALSTALASSSVPATAAVTVAPMSNNLFNLSIKFTPTPLKIASVLVP